MIRVSLQCPGRHETSRRSSACRLAAGWPVWSPPLYTGSRPAARICIWAGAADPQRSAGSGATVCARAWHAIDNHLARSPESTTNRGRDSER